uniref:Ribosomal protein n=1 Tax=Glossina brevipalpis TaxID=37001 RepID=A0A1A9X0H5_9MUSC
MSLTSKICTSLISNAVKRLTGNVYLANREYHGMVSCLTSYHSPIPTTVQPINLHVPILAKMQRLLTPVTALVNHVAGFKVKGRLKRRCKDCYLVVRQQRCYVICPTHPRHKQMAMKKRDYKTWILTHATQSKIRPY